MLDQVIPRSHFIYDCWVQIRFLQHTYEAFFCFLVKVTERILRLLFLYHLDKGGSKARDRGRRASYDASPTFSATLSLILSLIININRVFLLMSCF